MTAQSFVDIFIGIDTQSISIGCEQSDRFGIISVKNVRPVAIKRRFKRINMLWHCCRVHSTSQRAPNYQFCNDIMWPKVYHTLPLLSAIKVQYFRKGTQQDSDKVPADIRPHTEPKPLKALADQLHLVVNILPLSESQVKIGLDVKVCMPFYSEIIFISIFGWFGYSVTFQEWRANVSCYQPVSQAQKHTHTHTNSCDGRPIYIYIRPRTWLRMYGNFAYLLQHI